MQEYLDADGRFRVIDKANSGYGASMNQGLDAATGEYVAILESDDAFTPDALEVLHNLTATHNAQAVKADFWFYWSQNEKLEACHVISEGLCGKLVNPQEAFEPFYAKPSIWSGMYNRTFLKETIFASWKRRAPFAPHAPLAPRIVRGTPRQAQASVCRVSPGKPSRERPRRPGMPQRFGQHPQQPPSPWSFSIAAQPEYSPQVAKQQASQQAPVAQNVCGNDASAHSRANCQRTAEGARKALNQRFHLPGSQAPGQQP